MNRNNNIFNKYDIENKLKDFKEGKDYSILRENDKKTTYNFRNMVLSEIFKRDYVTVYEAAENWDSDNYNYHREVGEYVNDKNRITYRYEHRINKNGGFNIEWGETWGDGESLRMTARPAEPRKIESSPESEEVREHRKNLAEFEEKKRLLKSKIEGLSQHIAIEHPIADEKGREHERELRDLEKELAVINDKIRYHEDWLARNGGQVEKRPNDNHSDLRKENHELRQQLAEVKQQLAEVLEELQKLKNNSSGSDSEKLEQQIIHNEKLIKNSEVVSVNEIKDQINKSQALMNEVSATSAPNKDDKGSLPYVIGGSVILASVGIISYLLLRKNKQNK